MKQKCIICGEILEPTKENEIAQIEFVKRNKLDPSVLCTQLVSTLGTCKDGSLHETVFDDDDKSRMANVISDYDSEIVTLEKERKQNGELVKRREEILVQLKLVGGEIRESTEKIVDSEIDIETILTDYEAISYTKDIEFYRNIPGISKEDEKPEYKK